mmetsp:Transcript_13160/g.36058  ORF Transcript_13160/g.36058 Transcript_13160/m.36058 type:complete len:269 (+) Transcript_13160:111-917(+)
MVLRVADGDLLAGPAKLLHGNVHVIVLVSELKNLLHGLLGVEPAGLPRPELVHVNEAVTVQVQFGEVLVLLLRELVMLALHGVRLPEFPGRKPVVLVQVLLAHGLADGDGEDALVRLRVEQRGHLVGIQHPVAIHICGLELLGLDLLSVLKLLHLLLVSTIRLIVDVIQVLVQGQLPILGGVDLLKDGLDVPGGDCLAHVAGEGHDLLQRDLAVAVLVEFAVQGLQLLVRERLLLDVLIIVLLVTFLASCHHQQQGQGGRGQRGRPHL